MQVGSPVLFLLKKNMPTTRNGALTRKTSGSACLDLFGVVGSMRQHPAQAVHLFQQAWREEPALALRILLWCRDARGGAGERTTFRNVLHWLERSEPAVALRLVASGIVPRVGRWDDLLGVALPELRRTVAFQVGQALAAGDRLAAKWMPRSGRDAAWLANELGLDQRTWRKRLAALTDTVENRLCAGFLADVNFAHVPSVAAARYQETFSRRDAEYLKRLERPREASYAAYLESVKAGTAKMHASAVFPHDIVRACYVNDEAATVQWSQQPPLVLEGAVLPLCDVSGSMDRVVSGRVTALDVCLALGLRISEQLPAPWRNQVLTFTDTPTFHEVVGDSLCARVTNLKGAKWGCNTDLQKALEAILARAVAARDAGEPVVLPATLLVLSDMEFDDADCQLVLDASRTQTHKLGNGRVIRRVRQRHRRVVIDERTRRTNHQALQQKFAAAGFEVPRVVYWNLVGRAGNVPAGLDDKVVLVSGFSPAIAEAVLSARFEDLGPEQLMRAAVGVARYDVPGLTV